MIAEAFEVAPALAFAELRTTTDVMGKPPIKPLSILPIPCAFNSKLVSVILRLLSNRSDASMHNRVSIDATTAMVAPAIQTCILVKPFKLGKVIRFLYSLKVVGTGRFTKYCELIANELPLTINNWLSKIPTITATKAPGSIFRLFRVGTFSQISKIVIDTKVINTAPG